ncbi:MAG TPA: hypothetical protein DEU95_09675, partial [Chloroflexi bacterium]|nr:hypothetical protein [Chloroflexota bacterium]
MRRAQAIAVLLAMTLMVAGSAPVVAQDQGDSSLNLIRSFPTVDTVETRPDARGMVLREAQTFDPDAIERALAANASGAVPKTVFPPDERSRVSPAYNQIARLVILDRYGYGIGHCSGSIIGPNTVLTAAHCLYSAESGWVAGIAIIPGEDGAIRPFGYVLASWMLVSAGWQESFSPAWDWAIVTTEVMIGNVTGWLELGVLSSASLSSGTLDLITVGYPGDKPDGTQWETSGRGLEDVTDAFLVSRLDIFYGQSGSGIIRRQDSRVIGVWSVGTPDINVAVRVHELMIVDLLAGCAEVGCSFAYWVEPPNPADAFSRTWARTDAPVAAGIVSRTWMWGPKPFDARFEPYVESPGGQRAVAYFDKSRMEVTNPYGDQNSPWYVTNGLLVGEMVTGLLQTGDAKFEPRNPAAVNIAGDIDDTVGPMYSTFRGLLTSPALFPGQSVNQRVDRMGNVWVDPNMDWYGVTAAYLVEVPNLRHTVASPFWAFMNSSGLVFDGNSTTWAQLFENPFYATGYPIAEAYWATVKVGGTQHDVLIQCFQRR